MACLLCALLLPGPAGADVVVTEGTNFSVDVCPRDGRVAMDLLGSIWIVPARGGQAQMLTDGFMTALRPRWSPDGKKILYQSGTSAGVGLWLLDIASSETSRIGDASWSNQYASWHPDGERIVYSSQRGDSGFDIWETDLPTGLSWRITGYPGDEIEPAWSANGRHLAFIRQDGGRYTLVLRRHGEPDTELLSSDQPLAAPSWRPDGTLLTVLRQQGEELSIDMVILANPPLVRPLITGEDFFSSPVSWRNRQQLLYAADGMIKTRDFNDLQSRELQFRATVEEPETAPKTVIAKLELAIIDAPAGRQVIRGARLFDGIWNGYRENMDVLVDGGRIAAVTSRRDWPDTTVLDLGDVTILPGFVDLWSAMPDGPIERSGPRMLAYGVTTIVTDDPVPSHESWNGEQYPGPRVLRATDIGATPAASAVGRALYVMVPADRPGDESTRQLVRRWQQQGIPVVAENWNTGLGIGADLLVGAASLPSSPVGGQYQDLRLAARHGPLVLVSGMADSGTPGMSSLLNSRQAREFGHGKSPDRRLSSLPALATSRSTIVLGSKPNSLPPGMALHAELRALGAAGLRGAKLYNTAGSNAALVLGLENQLGRVTQGAVADLVLVAGDPLDKPADALSIVAVVRNGRFYSLVGLIERATAPVASNNLTNGRSTDAGVAGRETARPAASGAAAGDSPFAKHQ